MACSRLIAIPFINGNHSTTICTVGDRSATSKKPQERPRWIFQFDGREEKLGPCLDESARLLQRKDHTTNHNTEAGKIDCNNVLTGELMRVPLNRGSYLVRDDPAEIPLENGGGPNGNRNQVDQKSEQCKSASIHREMQRF
jgi:hypothetical protein